ncbi:MAG: glutamyl-Q tRNA(Asp) synthetase [Sphingomonadaceae bacterium]
MTTKFITRFAPSPTGRLHLGHAWSALCAHDAARAAGGRFLLRIEDLDTWRCRSEFVEGIYEDLRWLGLDWDGEVMVQSARAAAYAEALGRLRAEGLLFRCRCTRADIAASAPHGEAGPLYPGTCRDRDHDDSAPHCWRIDMTKVVGLPEDIIIARKDALASYHLAVVVDDAAQGVTHVIRGRDLEASMPVHIVLQRLLGLPQPVYHHHPLIVDESGERLAKRRRSPSLADMRRAGLWGTDLIRKMRAGRFPIGFARQPA